MASLNNAVLRRRLGVLTEIARREVERRQGLRERAAVWAILRPALAAAQIDPKSISGAWALSGAEDDLRRCGETPQLQRADAAFIARDPRLASRTPYAADLPERARKFIGQPPPDPWCVSLFDLCAWALAAGIERMEPEGVASQAITSANARSSAPAAGKPPHESRRPSIVHPS
jgi:hypothetical protein